MKRLHRSQIHGADYNPRKIDSYARAKLEKNLRKAGLIEALIWNERTGNLVGGHQRLSCLDAIAGTDDYEIDVAVVNLTPKQEREQNIALNNPSIQGTWDLPLLEDLISSTPEFAIDEAGFDRIDLEMLFGNDAMAELFEPRETDPELPSKSRGGRDTKEARKADIERTIARNDSEFYVVVVFDDREQREAFMEGIGLDSEERYLDGQRLVTLLGLDGDVDTEEPELAPDGNLLGRSDVVEHDGG